MSVQYTKPTADEVTDKMARELISRCGEEQAVRLFGVLAAMGPHISQLSNEDLVAAKQEIGLAIDAILNFRKQ